MDEIIEFDSEQGLDSREYTLLSRIHRICVLLAKSDRPKVVTTIKDEWQLDEAAAETWVRKAEDSMTLGAIDGVERAKSMYSLRLQQIYDLCMANAVRDMIEVTSKPTRVVDQNGETRIITAQHTRIRTKVLDNSALANALRAAKEIAIIAGARQTGRTAPSSVTNIQINNNDVPGANLTQDLSNDQLARLAGFEPLAIQVGASDVTVLPNATDSIQGNTEGGTESPPQDGTENAG